MYLSLHTRKVSVFHNVLKVNKKVFSRQKIKYIWFWKSKQTADFVIKNVNKQLTFVS